MSPSRINVSVPADYFGEVFVTFGDEEHPYFLREYNYSVDERGLFHSKFKPPRGRIYDNSFCFTYVGTQKCLPVAYDDRDRLLIKERNQKIAVLVPGFSGFRVFKLPNDSFVDFSNGYLRAVIDSLASKKQYDLDIKKLFVPK